MREIYKVFFLFDSTEVPTVVIRYSVAFLREQQIL